MLKTPVPLRVHLAGPLCVHLAGPSTCPPGRICLEALSLLEKQAQPSR